MAKALGLKIPAEFGNRPSMPDATFSPREVGEMMGVTGEAVKQWIVRRRLAAVKLNNGYWRIRKTDVENFLQNRFKAPRRRVLICSATTNDATAVSGMIAGQGYEITTAVTYADALLKTRDIDPALFILDMSGWEDGWKFAAKLRQIKEFKHRPILLVTSAFNDADVERAIELSAQGCLFKPLSGEVLSEDVRRILGALC